MENFSIQDRIENMSDRAAIIMAIVGVFVAPILLGVFLVFILEILTVLAVVAGVYTVWSFFWGPVPDSMLRDDTRAIKAPEVTMKTNKKYTDDDDLEKIIARHNETPERAMIGKTDDDALNALVESIERMRKGKSSLDDRVSIARAANKYVLQDGEYAF